MARPIVINALQYRNESSGIGILMRELFGRLTSDARENCQIILPKESPPFPHHPSAQVIAAPCTYENGLRRFLFQSFRLGPLFCSNAVLLIVDSKLPFLLPKSCQLLPIITDLAVFRMRGVYQRSRVLLWKLQYRILMRRADRFIAISAFTKAELEALFHIPSERIDVVPCAAAEHFQRITDTGILDALRKKYRLPNQFVLFVGNSNPRKNLYRLMRAFDRVKENPSFPHRLVIAGGQGWRFDRRTALKGIRHQEDIQFIDYVPDEDMPALYSASDAFVFPTLYEGFGIPVIEAQRCGTPVLTSESSSLPEVGGDGALYADPYEEADIADKLALLLSDPALRSSLTAKGYRNAARYSWQASADQLNNIIRERFNEWTQ